MNIKSTIAAATAFSATLMASGFIGVQKASALTVTPTDDGTTLTSTILGTGITVVPGSISYTGASGASGIFTGGTASGIGFNSGIILTTGLAASAVGPNNVSNQTTNHGTAGDAALDVLSGGTSQDAALLEFSFETLGGDLFFDYVFASEEYNEFTNSVFNDVFGFFLDGVNIALIPGTSTPVSINTVNGGNPLGTGASNPGLFNDNSADAGGPFFNLQYDGFTNVFTAKALGLSAGTHTISLGIADVGDSSLDSAVFIRASSFSDTPTPPNPTSVPEPTAVLGLVGLGFGMLRIRHRRLVG